MKLGSNPDDHREWMVNKVGEGMIDILRQKREDIGLAKSIKKNLKDVAKHLIDECESRIIPPGVGIISTLAMPCPANRASLGRLPSLTEGGDDVIPVHRAEAVQTILVQRMAAAKMGDFLVAHERLETDRTLCR